MNLMKEFLRPLKKHINLVLFKKKFRAANQFNEVVPENIFPLEKVKVGRYTYGHIKFLTWGDTDETLIIRDFVSIGSNVTFMGGGNHKLNSFSTFPFRVKFFDQKFEAQTKGPIIVDNDVWIGSYSLILSGITINQGAVVAAGSVVTKDVPPYAIVGGNPARVLKYRFDLKQVEYLKQIQFSAIDKSWITKNKGVIDETIEKLIENDIFLEKMKRENNSNEG